MPRVRLVLVLVIAALAAVLGPARPARADITAFLGVSPSPDTHLARGVAVGGGFLVVKFEFEYSHLSEDADKLAPSLQTGMFNGMLQTPVAVAGIQFYGTLGAGIFRERLGAASETNFGTNVGGGIKVRLIGPLRGRVDYRLFRLRGSPIEDRYHRFYAGVTLGF
jgi:hypothetical protein